MKIGTMFEKKIDRDIKGVIKVGQDDNANILQELDEYVVTRELTKCFRDFFDVYEKGVSGNTEKTGVWISGFFGSGKSHFLKILSYLLKNEVVDGKHAIDFFTAGNKLTDQALIGKIKRACAVPTDVIIFNIDAKGDADAKSTGKDAIVDVFMKAFNEMQGFCGSLPFLADLERKLSDDDKFELFQSKFQEITLRGWKSSREDFYFIQDDMIACLSQLGIMSEDVAKRWCEQAASTYSMSIEKFANLVCQYCEKKGNNHHVAFLVDEIGQYIADDSGLMLNLQTVTELLGKTCNGKAWVIVTGQEDVDSILKVKGGDFSKIQGRFDTHLSLSSANVDEVIRKRILEKNQTAKDTLVLLFDQKESILKNLITFSNGAEKKLYTDRGEFAAVYPFIPYQFRLLGQVLTAIRTHGASGKHLAEGERSMLALFQESAMQYMDCEETILVPFNTFYNALDRFIDHTHRIVLTHAADNSKLCEFDVNLLKVLFMIKYVEQTPGTVENLTTLMVSGIDDDRIALRKQVEGSLAALIRQMLVQKNGDEYTFLTNEEQDINRAISNETVEMGEIISEVSGIVFGELIREPKYRYGNTNRYNFPYNQRVDDRYYKGNQSAEIGVRILTPYSNEGDAPETLRMLSDQSGEVLVQLPRDDTFLSEISESLKISKFLSNAHSSLSKGFDVIKRAKQDELTKKRDRIRVFVEDAVKHADIYVCGDRAEIAAKDTASRINEALKKLVETRFSKLCYMGTAPDTADIARILRRENQTSLNAVNDEPINQLALDEVLLVVMQNGGRRIKTTLKFLQEKFSAAPYGFVELDVQWLVAMLFRQGKLSLTLSSKSISPIDTDSEELLRYITKREYAEKLIIEVREHASDRQMKAAKDVMKDLFLIPLVGEDDDALMKAFQTRAQQKSAEIHDLLPEYRAEPRFPGKAILEGGKKLLDDGTELSFPGEFFSYVDNHRDDFLDFAEDSSAVFSFFAGEQKAIFAKAWKYVDIFQNSKTYIVDTQLIALVEEIRKIAANPKPYSEIHKLPDLLARYADLHLALIEQEAAPVLLELAADEKQLLELLNSKPYTAKFADKFTSGFAELKNRLEHSNEVATVKNMRLESEALKQRYLDEMDAYELQLQREQHEKDSDRSSEPPAPVASVKKSRNVSMRTITNGKTVQLKTEQDVNVLLGELKGRLLKELETGDFNLMM